MSLSSEEGIFSMGLGTLRIPMSLHAETRDKLKNAMNSSGHKTGIVVLEGGQAKNRYDTDHELLFRQESYFNYLFGVTEPDCFGSLDLETGEATLFIPRLAPAYAIWQGEIKPPEFFQKRYQVNHVYYVDEMESKIPQNKKLYLLSGINTDSNTKSVPAKFDGIEKFTDIDTDLLHPIIANCRVIKTRKEIDVMRYSARVSSLAHTEVMRRVVPGMAEYQLESLFQHHTYTHGGCRHEAYTCICACGPNGSVLHYGHAGAPNDRIIKEGEMALLDMGAEYHCYASDITCSFPVSGTFTANQKVIYEGVLNAQKAVYEKLRPGVSWMDMHRLATKVCLNALIEAGILTGSLQEVSEAKLGPIFMPHGLGHLLGLDTHDVGGYLEGHPQRNLEDGKEFGICKLRTSRTLEAGMVLTVEPGIYFMKALLERALSNPNQAKYINSTRLNEFLDFGGVRLEDDILITKDGFVNLTICPRTVKEIESVMKGGVWPPEEDDAPWANRAWFSKPISVEIPEF